MATEVHTSGGGVTARRVLAHATAVLLLMAIGAYIFSYHVFSLFFPGQNPPFLLPVGMAAGLLLLAIPTLAGLGLRLLIDGFVRRKPILAADLFDLLAVMQYVAIGFVLIVGYLAIK